MNAQDSAAVARVAVMAVLLEHIRPSETGNNAAPPLTARDGMCNTVVHRMAAATAANRQRKRANHG